MFDMAMATVLLAASYVAFSASVSGAELVAALLSGVAAVIFGRVLATSGRPYRSGLRELLLRLPRILWSVPADALVVSKALALATVGHRPAGREETRRFEPGPRTAAARGRRGLAIWAISLAPNSFVTAVDYQKSRMVVHQLVPSESSGDEQWPL